MLHILKAFDAGADGVFVAGCLKGTCHYLEGNIRAEKRVEQAKDILDTIGLGRDRVDMFFMSSSEGTRFRDVATKMTERIKGLGPSPIRRIRGPV